MTKNILQVSNLKKAFGGISATDIASLVVEERGIHAIIGPNGAGKTTLISQLSGSLHSDSGSIEFMGEDITTYPEYKRSLLGLARSFQITSIFLNMSVLDNVIIATQSHSGHSYRFWQKATRDQNLRQPSLEVLKKIGLYDKADSNAETISHGEHRQLEIAMALATKPKLLLLDEPMAGMGPEESLKMVEILKDLKKDYAILLIEHDMDAVFTLADQISVLVYGEIISSGSPDMIRNDENVKVAYLGEEEIQDA
ncbi:MAG: ABC transporter ATP-binding protein [Proteobacteria bacterium]|nr:ABC transporter ATP-binding protein [Pseudomonadota bacterium]